MSAEYSRYSLSIKYSIRTLLATCALALAMNLACAQGSGVILLSWLGYVPVEDIEIRKNIMAGVDFMQTGIKIVIGLGLTMFIFFVYRAVVQYRRS